MPRNLTAAELDVKMPGLIAQLEAKGVAVSNNAGAILVDGYLGDILDAIVEADAIASEPCRAEKHSWDVFRPEAVDPYWMRCDLLGPHDEHENSNTGAKWRDREPDVEGGDR